MATKSSTVDEYIRNAAPEAQILLREMRAILKSVAPSATEAIKWGHPAFEDGRILFSFSAYKAHLTFFPTGPALEPFKEQLAGFDLGKDSVKLPYDRTLPEKLIREIATYRVKQVKEDGALWKYKDDSLSKTDTP